MNAKLPSMIKWTEQLDKTQSEPSPNTSHIIPVRVRRTQSGYGDMESWLQNIALLLTVASSVYLAVVFGSVVWESSPDRSLLLRDGHFRMDTSMIVVNRRMKEHALHSDSGNKAEESGVVGRIPHVIRQSYKTTDLSDEILPYTQSWKKKNPGWSYVFYTDEDCLAFVTKEFPQYLEAYKSLPKNVERADFFRYMIILRYGGIYADIDAECLVSMDEVLRPEDTLVVGWECDLPTVEAAAKRHFVRQRQVLQWVFAAAPGHPALREICDFVAHHAVAKMSDSSSNHNTLEKTGPGAWTDVILRHISRPDPQFPIRILPQIAFGVHPSGTDNLHPGMDGILVQHHFLGSWKSSWGSSYQLKTLFQARNKFQTAVKPSPLQYFPVDVDFRPSFSVMVRPSSSGALVGDSDVGLELTRYGSWQSGAFPADGVRVIDVLAGSLGEASMHLSLLDIGAGLGYFSMAAASRAHPVIAYEPPGLSLEPFRASIKYNHFSTTAISLYTDAYSLKHALHPSCRKPLRHPLRLLNGRVHISHESTDRVDTNEQCQLEIGVVRIGDTGWKASRDIDVQAVIGQYEPEIVMLEYSPWRLKEAGWVDYESFLRELVIQGYTEIYHAGKLCERRWTALSKHFTENPEEKSNWCNVLADDLSVFSRIPDSGRTPPENILFVKKKSGEETDGEQI